MPRSTVDKFSLELVEKQLSSELKKRLQNMYNKKQYVRTNKYFLKKS